MILKNVIHFGLEDYDNKSSYRFSCLFLRQFHVAQPSLKFTICSRITLSLPSCFYFPSARITGICQAYFLLFSLETGAQGFIHARQALFHPSYAPTLRFLNLISELVLIELRISLRVITAFHYYSESHLNSFYLKNHLLGPQRMMFT